MEKRYVRNEDEDADEDDFTLSGDDAVEDLEDFNVADLSDLDLDDDIFYFNYFKDLVVAKVALADYLRRRRSTKVDNCETVYTFEE